MVGDGTALPNHAYTPKVQARAVEQGDTGDDGKGPGCRNGKAVAKVEQRGCNGAEEDAKLEPGEEGTLCGELDLGLYTDGDVDTCSVLV